METDTASAEREWLRATVESNYEDALMAANSVTIGTPRFLQAMADVREARAALRDLYAGSTDPS